MKLRDSKPAVTFICSITCLILIGSAGADEVTIKGVVTDVTLYRNQARVNRTLSVGGAEGAQEVVVSELPENIIADSLFAEAEGALEIRAVQFRTRAIGQSPREEVRELQSKLRTSQQAIDLNQKLMALLVKQTEYLDKMENFVAPTASAELSKGVLNAESLEQVTRFNFSTREDIAQKEIELGRELFELQQQHQLLNEQLAEISNNGSKTVREAILFVQKNGAGESDVRLSYLVNSCGWSPSYTVRAEANQDTASLEFNGLIQQMSGEDWQDIELTLSTATPALSSFGPGLAPFSINLIPESVPQQVAQSVNADLSGQVIQGHFDLKGKFSQQQEAIYAIGNSINFKDNIGNSWGLNRTVNELACAQIVSDPGASMDFDSQIGQLDQSEREPSLSYRLDSPVSLTSRNSQQMVRVLQATLPSEFYHVATPVLTHYVFREAELNNDGAADFLAGPIAVYLDSRFVGRGEIPTVARGQTFVVGFGADSQLRTRRELVDRKTSINGGNREIKVEYRLVVENYKDTPVNVRVTDRLPKPTRTEDIRVTMLNPKEALSTNKVYERTERPHGILRWDAVIPARSIGDQVHGIEYSYAMEFDRKFQIALASDQSQQLLEFEEIQARRIKR